jgi:mannosidase alpha-like ER degradation enhancer 3
MVGGLISAHILSEIIQEKFKRMEWYSGQLLSLAKELGYRLLPAFNTSTGIPHPRVSFFLLIFTLKSVLIFIL